MDKVQVEILALSTGPSSGGSFALVLKEVDGGRRLMIAIGAFEAQAIAMELRGMKPERPMTHDLLRSVIENFNASVLEITVTELKENTFYAKITIDSLTQNLEIDSRPSDAIALAVRCGVPIFVSEEVMAAVSQISPQGELDDQLIDEDDAEKKETAKDPESHVEKVQADLREAIEKEEYERAAKLRDELRRLTLGD